MIAVMSMSAALATAVSGLYTNAAKFRVAAHNVVNANSSDFKAHLATPVSQSPSGVRLEISVGSSPVDLAREWVNMTEARIGYDANAQVISTLDRMAGALIDITA
jgi:flagellar hook protein FlgE